MTSEISSPIPQKDNEEGIIASAEGGEDLKFCADCKWLLGVRYKDEYNNWHCVHPNNLVKNERKWNLVTGIQEYIRAYHEGSLDVLRAEERYCGREGKWWEEYKQPEYKNKPVEPTIGGKSGKIIPPTETVFDDADLEASRAAAANRLAELKARKK